MARVLKSLCLIHFWNWKNSPFSLLALWGNKNYPPNIKGKQIENLQNKLGLKGLKWSSLNGPGTQVPLSQVLLVFYECDPFSRLVFLSLTARARPPALARSLFI